MDAPNVVNAATFDVVGKSKRCRICHTSGFLGNERQMFLCPSQLEACTPESRVLGRSAHDAKPGTNIHG